MGFKRLKNWLAAESDAGEDTPPKKQRRESRGSVLKMMPKESVCAEIGVWKGHFSARILNKVKPRALHLIDPWIFVDDDDYERAAYGGKVAKSQGDMDDLYEAVRERFEREIAGGVVRLHRMTSAEANANFPDDYFDWVYIDANHSYEFVKQDLLTYHPKVKQGGFFAGDDYRTKGWWGYGVTQAVDEFVASGKAKWALQDGSQFVLQSVRR